mmetsp:Transcript_3391/g.6646  ORF Transcript_3391/g.6646 Transcript_3391/m.6646 type:complete len:94 (-) Transcript_3391:586-867(-)|eukprot:CAMPEP_0170174440 /NCGR_PEP_ID=MMETSP0040_2-20121228/7662_1 /TAXON_ID=641309 /ORGANISM="Lotharella oceanica, Strain CCMP622" /LENGTH=93 /DNA_ID=CAMNT_0010416073 /DNA_START=2828 /DNA_END=3109 /DNA_ORIENTATION=-
MIPAPVRIFQMSRVEAQRVWFAAPLSVATIGTIFILEQKLAIVYFIMSSAGAGWFVMGFITMQGLNDDAQRRNGGKGFLPSEGDDASALIKSE